MSIPSSPRRSRIAHFKAPFILSVAGSAALGLGCGGKTDDLNRPNPPYLVDEEDVAQQLPPTACEGDPPSGNTDACRGPIWMCVDGEWEQSYISCNPPFPQSPICPESPADIGTSCASYLGGLSCEYDYCYGTTPMRRCNESTALWEDIPPPTCNPPPPEPEGCADTLPVPGSDCTIPQLSCSYPGACESPSTATCVAGQWVVTYSSGPACNPPAVVPVCPERELVSGESCAYGGQECSNEACESGAASHDGYVCSSGQWQAAVVSCPPSDSAPDAGAADAGGF